ncbi:MAG: TMEM165/GDT1 family protein [Pseudomonadota bacterium]
MAKLWAVALAVFLAEMGDKTQLATLIFAASGAQKPFPVFLAASAALIVATALAVLFGNFAGRYLAMLPLKLIAGVGFIAIGIWTLAEHFRAA